MPENLKKQKKSNKALFFVGLLAVVSCLMFALYPSKYKRNLTALEKTCADLTKSNPEKDIYVPIVGQYLASKSSTAHISRSLYRVNIGEEEIPRPSTPSTTNLTMYFVTGSNDTTVYYSVPVEQHKELFEKLFSVVGQETIKQKIDTNDTYGICAYLKENGLYLGELETFTKLKK